MAVPRSMPGGGSRRFFAVEGERGKAARNRELRAKAICASCPVTGQCRAFSLVNGEPYGVWGGRSEEERFGLLFPRHEGRRRR
jgi:WhiB family redox-sensing transcriptional regulator